MTIELSRQHGLQVLARQLPEPRNLFAGVHARLTGIPENALQFHRHSDRYLRTDAPFLHHRFVLVACLQEPGCIVLDGEVFRIEPGQGVLIFPYQSHHFARLKHPDRISWLFTTFEYRSADELEPLHSTPFTFETQDRLRLQRVTEAFLRSLEKTGRATHEMPIELALLLSGLLIRQHRYLKRAGGKPFSGVPQPLFLRTLCTFIDGNLGRSIPIGELSSRVHLSPSRLRARFRLTLGISLGEFIRRTRIHRACGLLHSTDLNITQISEKCGFNSLFAFSRAFHRIVGKPPSAFRADLRRVP